MAGPGRAPPADLAFGGAGPVKFLRHLGVVLRPGAGGGGPHGPVVIRNGPMNLGLGSMLDPVNLAVLRHTVVIEIVVIAIVVMIDVSRRQWRQERRARQLALTRPDDDQPDQ
jgi:hypothetical protein